jgi:predicted nucleotidyltransferase component of viral defense system
MNGKKDIAASIRRRLLNRSGQEKRPFNELLQYYAMERFLYRLSQSEQRHCFILKGALMLRIWDAPQARPTMDIDMLGRTDNDIDAILAQTQEIIEHPVEDDGVIFHVDSLKAETITEDADYQGVRVLFTGELSGARINMQLDIGFGDVVHPEAYRATFPILLDLPAPELLCYSSESAIAEKFQAMVHLGELNSRMKDFYDIWLLARQFDFVFEPLNVAVERTFEQRNTAVPQSNPLPEGFAERKQAQWMAFRRRLKQDHIPAEFGNILNTVLGFLEPIFESDSREIKAKIWRAPGPWVE